MEKEFDLEELRLPPTPHGEMPFRPTRVTSQAYRPKNRQRGLFVRGPVPMSWIAQAVRLPGKTPLAVGLWIWFKAGMQHPEDLLTICPRQLERFGLKPRSVRSGLAALEQAGLISIERQRGKCARVALIKPTVVDQPLSAPNNQQDQ